MPLSLASPQRALSMGLLAAAVLVCGFALPAHAADPSPAAITSAATILADIGMKKSFEQVVPGMMLELERNVTGPRPELREPLHAVVVSIMPDFAKTAQDMFDQASKILASQLSEQELRDTAAFFESASGKKYVAAEPVFLREFAGAAETWRQKLSTDILARARDEMKKKGYSF